jgi:hypothetical protein
MATLQFPKELNGFPLSDRSRHLMFAPVEWLLNPKAVFSASPFVEDGWVRKLLLAEWPRPEPPQDPLIAKRVEFHQRFAPEAAEKHWSRWIEQRQDIDREFDRTHPYWQERKSRP